MKEHVILVDTNDRQIGIMPKLEAHEKGVLHRAFSVFIFNSKGEMMLQQRALKKYHSAGLWSNACCSHPFPNELTLDAANRRLKEEMGISADLKHIHSFIYDVALENNLSEHEFDHVYYGITDAAPVLNKDEVANWKYISIENLMHDVVVNPNAYTEWLKICLANVLDKISFNN